MYYSAIPLKELTFKPGRQAWLYHKVTAYDHVIAYDRLGFVVVNMEAIINYLASRNFRHTKIHFDVICREVQDICCTILYYFRPHLAFILFIVVSLYHDVGSSAIPNA